MYYEVNSSDPSLILILGIHFNGLRNHSKQEAHGFTLIANRFVLYFACRSWDGRGPLPTGHVGGSEIPVQASEREVSGWVIGDPLA